MAHVDKVSSAQVQRVVGEIGGFFRRGLAPVAEGVLPAEPQALEKANADDQPTLEIGLTLTIWGLKPEVYAAVESDAALGDLFSWVIRTPLLYHQVRTNTGAHGFARSSANEPADKNSVFHVNISEVALRIHEAFEFIERNPNHDPVAASDPVVRLIEIPACHILAVWLFAEAGSESRLIVIDAGRRYGGLQAGDFLDSKEFFEVLRKSEHIKGVA